MNPLGFQDVRCPRCGRKLCEAFGISAHLIMRFKCASRECKDVLVQVREGFVAELIPIEKPVTP